MQQGLPGEVDVSGAATTAPSASSATVSQRMSKVRTIGTLPELQLRSTLHRRGLRYRLNRSLGDGVRCRPDLIFPGARVAVFVDGCFWHGCPQHASWPKANAAWWRCKLERNRERDQAVTATLVAAGWHVIRTWEHEPAADAAERIEAAVRARVVKTATGPAVK